MTLTFNGKPLLTPQDRVSLLSYWMEERNRVRVLKQDGIPKPWSSDSIFQQTYFCNVMREDDRVTQFIREQYSPRANDPMFEVNIVFSRLINWPQTLQYVGFLENNDWNSTHNMLNDIKREGEKVFGDAYIVSTNGLAIPKAQYVCEYLLPAAYGTLGPASGWRGCHGSGTLANAYQGLIGVRGLGSFMAGQIIADLKNTEGHPLKNARDWKSWCTPGPGSLRGMTWIADGHNEARSEYRSNFIYYLTQIRYELERQENLLINSICNQDLQNCLCEFDKYCRILTGVGRSKRRYKGV